MEQEEKLSITKLIQTLYRARKTIFIFWGAFLCIGFIYYIISPSEYATEAVLLPESSSSNSSLGGLASLAGINIGRMDGKERTLSSSVYEPIIKSGPFLDKILKTTYHFPSIAKSMTLFEYLRDYSTPSVSDRIEYLVKLHWLKGGEPSIDVSVVEQRVGEQVDPNSLIFTNSIVSLSSKKILRDFSDRIFYSKDMQTGLISISLELQDPDACAKVAQDIISELIQLTRKYQGQKDSTAIEQFDAQILSKKKAYEDALIELAGFKDRNINLIRSSDRIKEQKLENEVSFSFNIYNSLLQQREQILMQSKHVQDPIAIIEPVQVPTGAYFPQFLIIAVICSFIGILFGVIYVLLKDSVLVILN